jgi:glycosyltransferase involved in cell wall biosynthesis
MVLQGLNAQTYTNFDVIIADDGSRTDTRERLDIIKGYVSYPIVHVWHEDDGFRAGAIRNKAVAKASGELLVFLDGDSIPFPEFVERHVRFSEKGYFSSGNRILLRNSFTQKVLADNSIIYSWGLSKWLVRWLARDINRLLPLIKLPDWSFRKKISHKWRGVRTCNMACWRSDFYRINGFDEKFQGWGREDSDLAIRLINSGVLRKDVRYAIPVLHLWHQENDRSSLEQNDRMLARTIELKKVKADIGVDQYRS